MASLGTNLKYSLELSYIFIYFNGISTFIKEFGRNKRTVMIKIKNKKID